MIEEVVNSILEAEDVAKRRVAEAEAKANEIVAAAEVAVATYKKQVVSDNKKSFAEQMKQADELADTKASERLAELNAQTDKQTAAYSKNIDKAVKIIIEAK